MKPCPECGGQQLSVEVGLSLSLSNASGTGTVTLRQPRRKIPFFRQIFSSETNVSNVRAVTCLSCGYTTFFATELHNLLPND